MEGYQVGVRVRCWYFLCLLGVRSANSADLAFPHPFISPFLLPPSPLPLPTFFLIPDRVLAAYTRGAGVCDAIYRWQTPGVLAL